jgi:hypothetical protein
VDFANSPPHLRRGALRNSPPDSGGVARRAPGWLQEWGRGHRRKNRQFPVWPRRGQPWVAAGFNLRIAEPNRPFNPNGVDRRKGRPLQGRILFSLSAPVGFTYGYSRYPASRDGRRRSNGRLIPAPMGAGGEGVERRGVTLSEQHCAYEKENRLTVWVHRRRAVLPASGFSPRKTVAHGASRGKIGAPTSPEPRQGRKKSQPKVTLKITWVRGFV